MKKFIAILKIIKSLFDGSAMREAIEAGAVSFEGQGRDKYGR